MPGITGLGVDSAAAEASQLLPETAAGQNPGVSRWAQGDDLLLAVSPRARRTARQTPPWLELTSWRPMVHR